jgi:sRNA-binding protein
MSSTPPAPAEHAADPAAEQAVSAPATDAPSADAVASTQPATEARGDAPAAVGARLAELFPALFKGHPKPLKLRIQADIQERAPGEFTKAALSAFLRRYTGATSYLIAVSKARQRFDLDGQPAGDLSDEHRQVATEELTRRRGITQARREQEMQARRQRASLLRDFETTKLTTANFCALKGIAPEALDGLLAQARAEAQEDAQKPRHAEHHHGHRGERRDGAGRPGGPRREGQGPRREGQGRAGGERQGERRGERRGPRPDRAAEPTKKD